MAPQFAKTLHSVSLVCRQQRFLKFVYFFYVTEMMTWAVFPVVLDATGKFVNFKIIWYYILSTQLRRNQDSIL